MDYPEKLYERFLEEKALDPTLTVAGFLTEPYSAEMTIEQLGDTSDEDLLDGAVSYYDDLHSQIDILS